MVSMNRMYLTIIVTIGAYTASTLNAAEPIAATYDFKNKIADYDTFLIVFRNANKPRPLYITGKPDEGTLKFKPKSFGKSGAVTADLGGNDLLGGLVDRGSTEGEGTAAGLTWNTVGNNFDLYPCSAWLKQNPRPKILVSIKEAYEWTQVKDTSNTKGTNTVYYTAKAKLQLTVDQKPHIIQNVAVTVEQSPVSIFFSGNFSIKGEILGLSGEDAGEMNCKVVLGGFIALKQDFSEIIDSVTDGPVLGE